MENEIQKIDDTTSILLKLAIDKDLDIDKFRALIQLKNDEENRKAKREFDSHFMEMQKEFEPIEKTEKGYDYDYAPLSALIKKYGPIISKHGFSFKWRESALESGNKRVTIIISGWGHSDDSTYFDVPKIEGTKRQNVIQVAGTMSTYGERYTFKAGFGIVEIGADKDGQLTYDEGMQYIGDSLEIRECTTTQELIDTFRKLWTKYKDDPQGQKVMTIEKDRKKEELKNANNPM